MSTDRSAVAARWDRARRYGFTTTRVPSTAFVAKHRSHDDGPGHGMFLGPLGGPAFSRDLTGRFNRWHLHPGTHLVEDVDPAFLAVHHETGGTHHHRVLRAEVGGSHEVATLFPVTHERFASAELPFVVTLSAFSPVIPGDEEVAGLPVVVLDVHLEAVSGTLPTVDVAMFWPNLGGWRPSWVTTDDRGDRAWPGHHHAGNVNRAVSLDTGGMAVLQSREMLPGRAAPETCLSVTGEADGFSRQLQYKTDQNATGVPDHEQAFTLGAVRHAFATTGRLAATPDGSWPAHWHEPVGSAVAAHLDPGRRSARVRFVLAMDWPEVTFGSGRAWRRPYKAAPGRTSATAMSERAHREADSWLTRLDSWHQETLQDLTRLGWSDSVAGCVINELGLTTALGTAWVEGASPAADGPLERDEHLGLLEGFDDGYFYYDTTDLWHYAFPALTTAWPRLGDLVFADLEDALAASDLRERPVYRVAETRPMLHANRLPHDLGSAPEDPFVRLNGYVMRDDPNTWRDATPAHVLARLTHTRLTGSTLTERSWRRLCHAAESLATLGPVPRHDEFGDSTWDNLALRGHSTYAAALYAAMWAVLSHEADRRGQDAATYDARRAAAVTVLDELWNGEFFRAATVGKYTEAVMPDSTWGLFYADICGAPHGVPAEQIRSHLRAAYEICHVGYDDGRVGPLLIGERDLHRYERDGGEELQVNEVLVGSGWMFAAMLRHAGLAAEADDVADSLRDVLYGGTGLQFRTPASVDRDGRFRAPLNMRPLAIWWLGRRTRSTRTGGRA
ncbi:GH116 family glycosyl hydrolase [Georgenia alba]|uniref:GH116 family glycosyl hydrolase n=1 Tax=Georgenia alba TaxID=2233858 RepID=A0ABW2Q6P1_9MICO